MKVIDNIQFKIHNVHIRYENDLEKPGYSWGITLQEINAQTLDSTWGAAAFFDRYDPKNKDRPINKKVIKWFGIIFIKNTLYNKNV